jgi:aspartate kinase
MPSYPKKFKVEFDENVSYTIRHFDAASAEVVEKNKVVFLKQISRERCKLCSVI